MKQNASAQLAKAKCFDFSLRSPKWNSQISVSCGWIVCVGKESFFNIVSHEQLEMKFVAFTWPPRSLAAVKYIGVLNYEIVQFLF